MEDEAARADLQQKEMSLLESHRNPCLHPSLSCLKFSDLHWEEDVNFICSYEGCARTTRQKIRKDKEELNTTIKQEDLIDIYRTLHPIRAEYTFFSSTHGTYTKIDHIKNDGGGNAKLPSLHRNIEKQTETVRNNLVKTLGNSQRFTAIRQMPNQGKVNFKMLRNHTELPLNTH